MVFQHSALAKLQALRTWQVHHASVIQMQAKNSKRPKVFFFQFVKISVFWRLTFRLSASSAHQRPRKEKKNLSFLNFIYLFLVSDKAERRNIRRLKKKNPILTKSKRPKAASHCHCASILDNPQKQHNCTLYWNCIFLSTIVIAKQTKQKVKVKKKRSFTQ